MTAAKAPAYPHEKRVQRNGYIALGGTVVLGAVLVALADRPRLLGADIPPTALYGALLLGAIVASVAIARRSDLLAGIGAAILVLGVLPAADARPAWWLYALGILYGGALLLTIELVHMTERYERAHRAVESENVPEEHVNRVTDEALRTLSARAGVAALGVAAIVALAFGLAQFGPRQWRAAVETAAPLGVAVLALAVAGALSLYILARGATFRFRREAQEKEMLPDVAE